MKGNKIEVVEYFNQEWMKGDGSTSSHDGLEESSHTRRKSVQLDIRARLKDNYWEADLGGKVF